MHGSSFGQLRRFLTYGVPDIVMDPQTQRRFSCTSCGYSTAAISQPPGTSEWQGCP